MSGGFHVHEPGSHSRMGSIFLDNIAIITRRLWLAWGVYSVSVLGLIVGSLALLHI